MQGKLGAIFTLLGIFLGTYLYGLQQSKALQTLQSPAPSSSIPLARIGGAGSDAGGR